MNNRKAIVIAIPINRRAGNKHMDLPLDEQQEKRDQHEWSFEEFLNSVWSEMTSSMQHIIKALRSKP